jgi:phospho-N-acetylmuramoyl-pentapeptide-transferase
MFIEFAAIFMLSIALEVPMQAFWIKRMHKLKIEQVTKLYGPKWHEKTKTGTPTMGGVVFVPVFLIVMGIAVYIESTLNWHEFFAITSYPVMTSIVGFADDWIKHRKRASDGMTSLQKLSLQILITVPWAMWVAPEMLEILPNIVLPYWLSVSFIAFAGVGLQNAVNVTDGLDGLAAGAAVISFFAFLAFVNSTHSLLFAMASAAGICLGFLWHNANPATVFMGDVGAHFISGLLITVCVLSDAFILIIPLSCIYGVEIISVVIQIFSIRILKRKVFRMSPLHHHFEMKGWSENKIVMRFWLVHLVGMFILYLILFFIAQMA